MIDLEKLPIETDVVDDGALLGRKDTDYVGGERVSAIGFQERNPSGSWLDFLPVGEIQKGKQDYMDCVSRSLTNSIEVQEKHQTGKESNYSERVLAIWGNTTPQGAYLHEVVYAAYKRGLALQELYKDSGGTWAQQHAPIPNPPLDIIVKDAEGYLTRWGIAYEWIPVTRDSFVHHLKHAPIQVVFPNHAVCMVHFDPVKDIVTYFDSYSPFVKRRALSQFTSALKIVLTKKNSMQLIKDNGTVYLVAGLGKKVKLGISHPDVLSLFGDEPVVDGSTDGYENIHTITPSFVIHKNK